MTDIRTDDLKISDFVTTSPMCRKEDYRQPIAVNVDSRAAVRQAIIVRLRHQGIEFHTRSDWGATAARESSMTGERSYDGVALHHAGNSHTCAAAGAEQLRSVQAEHLRRSGYTDIGYHYAVDCAGAVYEARDIRFRGAHIESRNTGLVGIVMLADLSVRGEQRRAEEGLPFWKRSGWGVLPSSDDMDLAYEEVTTAQIESSGKLIEALRQHFPIESLGGHSEWAKLREGRRSCPGVYGMIATDMLRTQLGLKKPA